MPHGAWDPDAAWRAAARLRAHRSTGRVTAADALDDRLGVWLEEPEGYGTVLVDPPPDGPWRWVALAADLLRPGGRAVVTVPLRALADVPLELGVTGRVAAVIGLPADARAGQGADLCLLLLGTASAGEVLFLSEARPARRAPWPGPRRAPQRASRTAGTAPARAGGGGPAGPGDPPYLHSHRD